MLGPLRRNSPMRRAVASCALAVAATAPALAAPADSEQPIHIEADEGVFDPDGVSVLTGAVALRQGSLRLNAFRMTLMAEESQLRRIVAEGDDEAPATFRQQPRPGEPVVRARAKRIDYAVAEQRITLQGDAFVAQADQEIAAEAIDWNLEAKRVEARSSEPGGVRMKWQPPANDGSSASNP